MNPPKSIKIGPFVYEVSKDQAKMDRAAVEGGDGRIGECDTGVGTIYLSPKLGPMQQAETLLHEIFHAITDMTGIAPQLGMETDEIVVRALSPAFLDLLRRNPALVRYLTT